MKKRCADAKIGLTKEKGKDNDMSDLLDGARETLERAQEKAAPVLDNLKEKAAEAKEKAAPAMENVKEKVLDAAEKVQEKAAPVVEKVRDGVSDAVDAVRNGLRRAGGSRPEVDNPLFDELEAQARAQKSEAQARAEEMQRMLERMMGGRKED